MKKIDGSILAALIRHNRSLGIKRMLKSVGYERAAELPYIVSQLAPQFNERGIKVIDVGAGDSVLPSYLLCHTDWHVTCVDKFGWVRVQEDYVSKAKCKNVKGRLRIVEDDVMDFNDKEAYDVLICVSVIEHFEADSDLKAVRHMADLLRPGGVAIFTVPMNEGYPRDFYKKGSVYGAKGERQTFYQRHYDLSQIQSRLIEASGMKEKKRLYFGEYGFAFGQYFVFPSVKINPFKVLYKWAAPYFAKLFVSYSDNPISRPELSMDTAAGIVLILEKR